MADTKKVVAPKKPKAKAAKTEKAPEVEVKAVEEVKVEKPKAKAAEPKVDFGTETFFIEDAKFFEELQKEITDKANIDDFVFSDAKYFPERVQILMRNSKWAIKTTSNRGNLIGVAGDFLLRDPNGNKLKVASKLFRSIYDNVIK